MGVGKCVMDGFVQSKWLFIIFLDPLETMSLSHRTARPWPHARGNATSTGLAWPICGRNLGTRIRTMGTSCFGRLKALINAGAALKSMCWTTFQHISFLDVQVRNPLISSTCLVTGSFQFPPSLSGFTSPLGRAEDAMDLSVFADESFDVVFDKSTLDALKCRGAEATSSSSAWQLVGGLGGSRGPSSQEYVFLISTLHVGNSMSWTGDLDLVPSDMSSALPLSGSSLFLTPTSLGTWPAPAAPDWPWLSSWSSATCQGSSWKRSSAAVNGSRASVAKRMWWKLQLRWCKKHQKSWRQRFLRRLRGQLWWNPWMLASFWTVPVRWTPRSKMLRRRLLRSRGALSVLWAMEAMSASQWWVTETIIIAHHLRFCRSPKMWRK